MLTRCTTRPESRCRLAGGTAFSQGMRERLMSVGSRLVIAARQPGATHSVCMTFVQLGACARSGAGDPLGDGAAVGARTSYLPGTFCWADIATPDVESAKAFYCGLLGWDFEHMASGDAPEYIVARRDCARVAALHEATDQPPHWNNYVTVEDANLVAQRTQELRGSVFAGRLDVLSAGRMTAVSDPQGAMVIAWNPAGLVGAEVVNGPGVMAWNDLLTAK